MSENREDSNHGSKRKVKKLISIAGTGAQTGTIHLSDAELFEFNTAGGSATTLTLTLTGLYDGASAILDYDSAIACDTLTIEGGDGSGDTILIGGSFDDNARNHVRIDVLDATAGAEVISVIYTTIA